MGKRTSNSPDFPLVGIGASAGGLEALEELCENLPMGRFSCVIVQHLAAARESLLAPILSRETRMSVMEAKEGMKPEIDCIYTIPPDSVITLLDGALHLTPRKEMAGQFLPIDRFFQSLAESHKERAIAIVLSGAGSDGAVGVQQIKESGGVVFAQDEKSAKYFGMPQSAINTGAVDFVLSPKQIAERLGQFVLQEYWSHHKRDVGTKSAAQDRYLKELFRLLHKACGVDFSNYKISTLSRRISRRMAFRKIDTLANYFKLLKGDTAEAKALCPGCTHSSNQVL